MTNRFSDLAVPCSSNLDCARLRGFTSCGQRTAGAFTPLDVARTIVMRGTAAGALDEVAAKPLILAGTLCVPPSSSLSADLAADVPGPAAISLRLLVQLR